VRRAPLQHTCQFPGEIDGIADAGVHTLSAGGAVNVCGIAEQEQPPAREVIGNAMMHAIG
jgi:hypothetical protein